MFNLLLGDDVVGRELVVIGVKALPTSGFVRSLELNLNLSISCVVLVRGSENPRVVLLAGQHALIAVEQLFWSCV